MLNETRLFERARKVMPGGVCSSTRLNKAIGKPFYVSRGAGGKLYGLDGKEYIDLCCAHGAALLGHGHPAIIQAMEKATSLGYACSAETEFQVELAERLCKLIPCFERVRFCTSGSEATLHLLRACRAFTGRDKVIRFVGHFHGYHGFLYIGGHPPMDRLDENLGTPYIESPGIPEIMADLVIPLPFNDISAFKAAVDRYADEVCAVILEPVNYNAGGIKPAAGYLEELRSITRDTGILLFFDEIQSSFKKSPGGAQEDFGVVPDVCTIGKSLGGGMPLSAFGGRADIMDMFQPEGPVQHSGTFNAHLVQILAGLAFLDQVEKPDFYPTLQRNEKRFHNGVDESLRRLDVPVLFPHHGARFNIITGVREEPERYADLRKHDKDVLFAFIKGCIDKGVYFHDYGGSACHHGYSVQHTEKDIDKAVTVIDEVLTGMKGKYL